jgi:cardiolipin synthase
MGPLLKQKPTTETPFSSADWAEQVFSRTAGAPVSTGNNVEILKDAVENYPVWLRSIESAEKWIHFESYIIHEDETGREFSELLAAKAKEGVRVRLIYDWFGGLGKASQRFWQRLRTAGVEVRCFNPPRPDSPWDGSQGPYKNDRRRWKNRIIKGLCVGRLWAGNPVNQRTWRIPDKYQGPAIAISNPPSPI